ncbi:DUF3857 domain-containing transglutaminase family protein [Zeaxanthinibacter enoshimensis]|uniref:Transglutaminase superfamily protein n=1 Tax=Zeaxanthinibacter enoshimensis TaxID=392009 RepID=A0A4R6TIQ9_9FLAO|nr:DUF3857 domain-containing transglutaminase family protein [Zeaxanthinibacter enoshimensis]TDQ30656.1 transglutaminase superfamily protein [Zeaxanthinibacter enoshimensis]
MRLYLSLLLIGSCLYLQAQTSEYQSLLLKADLAENAHSIVRLEERIVNINALDEMTIEEKRVITVKNKHGNEQVMAYAGYDNSTKIKHIQAIIYDAYGKEIEKVKEKDFMDVSAVPGGTLYSDNRVKYLRYTPTQYPYTIEFTYELATKNTAFIPTWTFFHLFHQSIEKSHFKINYASPELKPILKELNLEGIEVERTENPGSIAFTATGIKAIKEEPFTPPTLEWMPMVQVRMESFQYEDYLGQMRDWKEVGAWMYNTILQGRDQLSDATLTQVRTLTKGKNDPVEKAKIIYDFVQRNTRYISVQVGIGGIQPISASEVDRLKYGDCKGLSNYTMALLAAVGVPAYYTHVEAGPEKIDFMEDFADLKQGNHVILAIPDESGYHWIDCTSQVHPFGFLGDFTDDRTVLVMKPEGGELTRTPVYRNEDNYQNTEADYTLDSQGNIIGNVEITTRGIQYDNHFTLENEAYDEQQKYYKKYWSYINNLSVTDIVMSNDKETIVFKEKVTLKAENYANQSGQLLFLNPNAFNRNTNVPDRVRNRKLPFQISRGYLDEDVFSIQLPPGFEIEAMPEFESIRNEFGEYEAQIEYDKTKHQLQYRRKLLVKEGSYEPAKYNTYREFRKKVARNDSAHLVLKKI